MVMHDIPALPSLGRRIMILGLTNSGKSTLAVALSGKLGIPAIHLDQLQHRPNTNWEQRPEAEFVILHNAAIEAPEWIVDGAYSRVMPQRLARATGIIVITDSLATRYRRYFSRTLFQKVRAGALEGGQDRLNWKMLGWLWKTRNSIGKYQQVAHRSGLPHVFASNRSELDALYTAWKLTYPSTSATPA
jgi:adenylate kinase family enzyme